MEKTPSGVPGFDEITYGGFPKNRVHLICGPPGSGKTTFGVQFLVDGALHGENGVYISLVDKAFNVVEDLSNVFPKLQELIKEGKIKFIDFEEYVEYHPTMGEIEFAKKSPILSPYQIFFELKKTVSQINAKRFVIDSLSMIKVIGTEKEEFRELAMFIRNLANLRCTGLIISEMLDPRRYSIEQYLCHSVIFLHSFLYSNKMIRAIQIMKMRGVEHDNNLRILNFTSRGIRVGGEIDWDLRME